MVGFNGADLVHSELGSHSSCKVWLAGRRIVEKADQPVAARFELCREEGMVPRFDPDQTPNRLPWRRPLTPPAPRP